MANAQAPNYDCSQNIAIALWQLTRQEAQEVIHNSVSILKIDEQTIGMGEYPNG